MGFTAAMDDFDDARFARGPAPLDVAPAPSRHGTSGGEEVAMPAPDWLRDEEDVVETVLAPHGGGTRAPARVQVQGLTVVGRVRVRAEMQLLGSLEIAGVLAVPGILSIEDDGYVREAAPPLDRRSGRRAAEVGTPATAERAGTRRARDQLDALVDALHERGWVLGAATGHGVGLRADGTVVVLDLRGLMPHDDLAACRADRRWVDSVLTDSERTLRRRIQDPHHGGIGGTSGTSGDVITDVPVQPEDPAGAGVRGLPGAIPAHGEVERSEPATVRPVPRGEHAAPVLPRIRTRIRELMTNRRSRRTTLATAAAVLLAGTVLGTGIWLVMPSTGQQPSETPSEPVSESAAADLPAPPIDDPWALAAELAGARHAYVTGLTPQPVAAPGSDALAADIAVRAAYDGYTVEGGGPVIHEAEVLQGPTEDGMALLRILTSSEAADLVAADGTRHPVPATGQESIDLEIHWDGTGWRVLSSAPASAPAAG